MPIVVSISSLKGGVGKTSITLGLASAALVKGLSVLVVDMDPHSDASTGLAVTGSGTDIGTMLAAPRKFRFLDELLPSSWNHIAVSSAHEEDSAPGSFGSIMVAAGSAASSSLESLPMLKALPRLKKLAGDQFENFDLVLIDCPPTLGRLTSMAWAASDRVLSVTEPSLFSVAGTERTLRAIARFKENTAYSVDAASVVMNMVRKDNPEHTYRIDEMKTMFGDLVAEPALPYLRDFQRIQGSAYPVHYWPTNTAVDFAEALSTLLRGLLA